MLVRATFALGGLGSGFADTPADLRIQCEKVPYSHHLLMNVCSLLSLCVSQAFAVSDQILIDQDLRGWKEVCSESAFFHYVLALTTELVSDRVRSSS